MHDPPSRRRPRLRMTAEGSPACDTKLLCRPTPYPSRPLPNTLILGLGEGGMATVYLADDLKHQRKVALKVLKPELAAVVGAERFLAVVAM